MFFKNIYFISLFLVLIFLFGCSTTKDIVNVKTESVIIQKIDKEKAKLNVIDGSLYDLLDRYNKHIYVPAKHDMEDHGRPHLFSTIDAVAVCYLTMEIGKKIIKISKEAEDFSNDYYHNSYKYSFKD